MPKRTSAWAVAAALTASLALGQPPEAAAAQDAEKRQTGAVKWDRLTAEPDPAVADEIAVHTVRTPDGKAIEVMVTLALPLDADVVWAVLNDYENMPRFVPDIVAARLIGAQGGKKRVEIEGVLRLLFLDFPVRTTLDVVELPGGSVAIDSAAGNLAIHGVVRVRDDGPVTRVDYQVRMTPDFWLPPLIGDFLIGRQIRRQFEGMVAEMHRRANSHRTQAPGPLPLVKISLPRLEKPLPIVRF